MLRDRSCFPAVVIVAILAGQMAVVQVWSAARRAAPTYVEPYFFGLDYRDFYDASQALVAGKSPYEVARYVTPPLPALVNVPLSLLAWPRAVWIAAALLLVALFGSYALAIALFYPRKSDEANWLLVLGVVGVLLSYPFHFLLDRVNIDSVVLVLMMLAVWWSGRRPLASGVCLGLAVATKVYPVLLAVPLMHRRRGKELAAAGVVLLAAFLVVPGVWIDFGRRTLERVTLFDLSENGSIVATFTFLGEGLGALGLSLGHKTWRVLAVLAYVSLFLLSSYADWLKGERRGDTAWAVHTLLYFPFMVAMPQQAYHYSLVVLLPLIPAVGWLWSRDGARARRVLLLMAVGIALSQVQAVAFSHLVGNIIPHVVPGIGLLLVMVGATWYKLRY